MTDQPKTAEEWKNKGNEYFEKEDYQSALDCYNKAIELAPNYGPAYNNIGRIYRRLEQYEKAIDNYQKSIELGFYPAYGNLGSIYCDLKEYNKALEFINRYIDIVPRDYKAYLLRIDVYKKTKRYIKVIFDYFTILRIYISAFKEYRIYPIFDILKTVIKPLVIILTLSKYPHEDDCNICEDLICLKKSEYNYLLHGIMDFEDFNKEYKSYLKTRIKPTSAEEYNERGRAFLEFCFYDKAIKDFSKALKLDKNNPLYLKNRANAYSAINKNKKALKDLDEALKINPHYAEGYSAKAHVYYLIKQYDKAIENYTKALELATDYEYKDSDYSTRAHCYEEIGDYKNAIIDHSNYIQLHPDHAQPYIDRGFDYLKTEQYSEAIDDFNKYLELCPDSKDAYCGRGFAYFNTKNFEKAVEDYTKAIEFYPENPNFYVKRGLAYGELNKLDNTIDDFKKAFEYKADLDFNWRYMYLYLAAAYFENGDYQNALLNLNKLIKDIKHFDGKKYEPYVSLADVYDKMGDEKKAAEYLAKAKELGYVMEGQ